MPASKPASTIKSNRYAAVQNAPAITQNQKGPALPAGCAPVLQAKRSHELLSRTVYANAAALRVLQALAVPPASHPIRVDPMEGPLLPEQNACISGDLGFRQNRDD
jgi:hypothetical protein